MKEWILTGLVMLLFTVSWFSIRSWVKRTNEQLELLVEKIEKLMENMVSHHERLNNVDRRIDDNARRLNDHSKRIRKLEIKK